MEQVYIFDFGDRLKIGYSTNVVQRLIAIESASGAKAKQTYTVNGTRQIEKAAHYYLREHRTRGEYFTCDFETAKQALDGIINGKIVMAKKISESRRRANEKYNAKAYEEIKVRVIRGRKAEVQAHAEARSESVNGFINRAITETMEREGGERNGN